MGKRNWDKKQFKTGCWENNGIFSSRIAEKVTDEFDSGLEVVKVCGKKDIIKTGQILMLYTVYNNIIGLYRNLANSEWLAYLKGYYNEEQKSYVVTELVVPKQQVTGASVEGIEPIEDETGIIGTIHSHNTMGAFFSGTDHDYIGSNDQIMIVIGKDCQTKQQIRQTLPCGALMLMEATLTVFDPDMKSTREFIASSLAKITKTIVPIIITPSSPNQGILSPEKKLLSTNGYVNIAGTLVQVDSKGNVIRKGDGLSGYELSDEDIKEALIAMGFETP